jgi:hypothetical protein
MVLERPRLLVCQRAQCPPIYLDLYRKPLPIVENIYASKKIDDQEEHCRYSQGRKNCGIDKCQHEFRFCSL